MLRIAYVTNAPPQSGMGKPAREILRAVRAGSKGTSIDLFEIDGTHGTLTKNGELTARVGRLPGPRGVKPVQWWRLSKYLPDEGYDLWHLTNQTLSFIPRTPAIMTVYDLIEILEPQERFGRPVARFLYRGIPRAAHVICVSAYTKRTVQDLYRVPEEQVTVIPLGVRRDFTAIPRVRESLAYHEFLRERRLSERVRVVLYVGSDHPRKNLGVLAEALAIVRRDVPDATLLKVGDPGLPEGREHFLQALDRLHIRDAVRFIGNVGDEELRFFYSMADVLVFPSTFEGFGIPPLEAMACGCPVVCSNATSLPEIVGEAGILCDPRDPNAFANAITQVLTDASHAKDLRRKGLTRVPQFFWEGIAEKTVSVYRRVFG